ncbi:MAG: HEAT repeat domain-containing protein [Polyangiaceae bacterium]
MGIFDFFKGSKNPTPSTTGPKSNPPAQDKNVARHTKVVGDKLAQNYDRIESIEALCRVGTSEAVAGLLKRFTFYVDPSTVDQEEKELAFRGIVDAREAALEPIRKFCEKAESLAWPLKILRAQLEEASYVEEVLALLENFDTDYSRNVDPKVQLIEALDGKNTAEVLEALLPFVEDVSEPVRFQVVTTLLSLNNEAVVEPLVDQALVEESVRIKNKIAEGFRERGWQVPEGKRAKFEAAVMPRNVFQF